MICKKVVRVILFSRYSVNYISILLVFITIQCVAIIITWNLSHRTKTKEPIVREIDETVGKMLDSKTLKLFQGQACIFPQMTPWNSQLQSLYDKNKPASFECLKLERNWVETDLGKLKILVPGAKCNYTPIARVNDNEIKIDRGNRTYEIRDGDVLTSDFFEVSCRNGSGNDTRTYGNTHAAISYSASVVDRSLEMEKRSNKSQPFSGFNVLMFAFDSVSRLAWMRSLPKSHEYFVHHLGGFVFQGHTIVGDGTTPQLLAFLTGQTEEELPESRRGFKGAQPVDGFPWIWNDFKNMGYVTQYGEDMVGASTFNYRLLGFKKQPVDHYLRTFMVAVRDKHDHSFCLRGSVPEYQTLFKWMLDFARLYENRPKFSFVFNGELTHDTPFQLPATDDEMLKFLQTLNQEGILENTMLVLMSDHGSRFSEFRKSERGRLEERNPYFGIRLPASFLDKHKDIWNNLNTNVHRLTSPFDLYETLREFIHFTGSEKGKVSHRGISLFKEIPKERTCVDAGILPHWCTCLNTVKLDIGDALVQRAGKAAVTFVNNMTANERERCVELSLESIERAVRFGQNENVLKFKGSLDVHGRKPDLSDTKQLSKHSYHIQLVTSPNHGVYEITVDHDLVQNQFVFDTKSVSRLDRYALQPHCVMQRLPHLRQFCYCKVQI